MRRRVGAFLMGVSSTALIAVVRGGLLALGFTHVALGQTLGR